MPGWRDRPVLMRRCACGGESHAGGECDECRKKRERPLQRSAIRGGGTGLAPPVVHRVLGQPGQPLDPQTRGTMESRFGRDFSQVRVHTDSRANQSAAAVDALAYTVGRNVVFAAGQYSPATAEGHRLLRHELAHVVQQAAAPDVDDLNLRLGDPSSSAEDQAREWEKEAPGLGWALGPSEPTALARKPKKGAKKPKPKLLTLGEITSHISANNQSSLSTELLSCLIWKESGFNPAEKNATSSATGLMQLTKGAVQDVNRNTPKGVHFERSEMTDPAKNIDCGTRYLEMRIQRAGGDLKKGLNGFGTGAGYADNILECETCLKDPKTTDQEACLHTIHG